MFSYLVLAARLFVASGECGNISKSQGPRRQYLAWSDRKLRVERPGIELPEFGFGDPGQQGEAMAMFGREIPSCEKPPAMFDDSALALEQEGSDTWGKPLKGGGSAPKP